jgi:hypothetical protein
MCRQKKEQGFGFLTNDREGVDENAALRDAEPHAKILLYKI